MYILGTDNGSLHFLDIFKFEILFSCFYHSDSINDLVYLDEHHFLISASSDFHINIYNLNNFSDPVISKILNYTSGFNCICFIFNELLASGSNDNVVNIWNMSSGFIFRTFYGHSGPITSLALYSDRFLASGSIDQSIRIFDMAKMEQFGSPLFGHTSSISCLIFFPNGILASGGDMNDSTIRIWNISILSEVVKPLEGHNSSIKSLLVLPNGKLCSLSKDGTIKIWNSKIVLLIYITFIFF